MPASMHQDCPRIKLITVASEECGDPEMAIVKRRPWLGFHLRQVELAPSQKSILKRRGSLAMEPGQATELRGYYKMVTVHGQSCGRAVNALIP